MKVKTILLIILCFILCGCSAEVNIELDRNFVTEDTTLYVDESDPDVISDYRAYFRQYTPVYNDVTLTEDEPDEAVKGVKYYSFKETKQNYGYDWNYYYKFNIEDYNYSRLLKNSFKSAYLVKDTRDDSIEFYTDGEGITIMKRYPQLTNVKVNIKTDLLVLETNADSVNGNVYTWNFDRSNYQKNIYIKTSVRQKSSSSEDTTKKEEKKVEDDDDDEDEDEDDDEGEPTVKPTDQKSSINKSTAVDPEEEKKQQYIWILIPIGIIALLIVAVLVNKASKFNI